MKTFKKLNLLVALLLLVVFLSSCSKSAENEHLPEYCRSYSTFMETASPDLYELVDGINRYEYLNAISEIELEFEVDEPGREIDLDGIQCFQNLTSLSLSGVSFKDISEISALKNIQEITLVNTSVVSIDSMKNLSKVKSLTITNTKSLQSVKGVGEMTKLTKLELVGNGIVNIDELSKLSNLVSLDLSDNEMEFFPSISGLESLETLNLSSNRISGFGEDLSGLANVHYLNLSDNQISDLEPFGDLRNLEYLNLSNNKLGLVVGSPDFSSLVAANGLLELHLNSNGLTDISGLGAVNIPNLEELYLHDNEISDIQFISSYNKLLVLTLNNNKLTDINNLSGMTGLSAIDLSNNEITSFGGLTNLSDLTSINLFNNKISVIPDLQSSLPKLVALDISYNLLTDTSGIEGHLALVTLDLSNNGLETLSGLKNMPYLSELVLNNETPVACINDVEPTEFDCIPLLPFNPNEFTRIEHSFVTLPSLTDIVTPTGSLDFEMITFGDHLEIIESFIDIASLTTIDFTDMNVTEIDEHSFSSNHIQQLLLGGNSFTDIRFALGNPNLVQLNINGSRVDNISVISGQSSDDFNNLQYFYGEDILIPQPLDGAFIDLPEIAVIALIRTNITSISNSFNGLNKLSGISLSSINVSTINNSFNGLFNNTVALGNVTNGINFNNGEIEVISNSFNDSVYSVISLNNQAPLTGEMLISNSFNRLEVETISIKGSLVSSALTSFANTVITEELDLSNNQLTTLSDFNTTSVISLKLANNELSTVAFIHDIPSLEYLDISNQIDVLLQPTLNAIDGINNVPNLPEIDLTGLQITAIDGFKNTGLTTFEYQKDEHNDVEITTISATSFENALITDLDLEGHVLMNVDFLDNMPLLEDITLFTDIGDLSYLIDAVYKESLVYLYLGTPNNIIDFSPLSGYDSLDTFVFGSTATTSINNLDNLPSVSNINFVLSDFILTINNSFNNMDSMNVSDTYISTYPNLVSVSTSFDMITSSEFELQGSLIVADSFNNVVGLEIHSDGEITPQFDALSFDNLESVILDNPAYTTFEFLSYYDNLNLVTVQSPSSIVIDGVTSTSIQEFIVHAPGINLTNITISLPETARLTVTQAQVPLTIDATYNNIDVTSSSDVIINTVAPQLNIDGFVNNLEVNGNLVSSMGLQYLSVVDTLTINASILQIVTDTVKALPTALVVTINSQTPTQDISVQTPELNIENLILSDVTISAIGAVTIETNETNVMIQGSGETLFVVNPLLTDITHNVSFNTLDLSANNLAYIDFSSSDITNYSIASSESIMAIDGISPQAMTIVNNNMNQLTLGAPSAIIDFTTTQAGLFTVDGVVYQLDIDANNMTTLLLENSTVEKLNVIANMITTLQYVDSITDNTILTSATPSMNVIRTHVNTPSLADIVSEVLLYTSNLSSISSNTPSTMITIESDENAVDANVIAEMLNLNGGNLVDVTVNDSSNIIQMNVVQSPLLESVDAGNATIQLQEITSESSNLTILGNNIVSTEVYANNLIAFIANLNDNALLFKTEKPSILNMDITAGAVELRTNLQSIILGNSSNIDSLLISNLFANPNFSTLSVGLATVDNLTINDTDDSLSVSGLNILSADITSTNNLIESVFVEIAENAPLSFSSNANEPLIFTTNTDNVIVNGNTEDGIITVNSSKLTNIDIESNDVTLNLSKPSLDLNLNINAKNLVINAIGLNNVMIDDSSLLTTVTIGESNLTRFEYINRTPQVTSELTLLTMNDSDMTSFETSGDVREIVLNTPLLSTYTKIGVILQDATINTNNTSFSLIGIDPFNDIVINGANLTDIGVNLAKGNSLTVDAASLSTLTTIENFVGLIRILASAETFDLVSKAQTIFYEGDSATNFTLDVTNNDTISLETTTTAITIYKPVGNIIMESENVTTIEGVFDELNVAGITHNNTLSVNAQGNALNILQDNILNEVVLQGSETLGSMSILTQVPFVNTNNVTISNINFGGGATNVTLDTLAVTITAGNPLTKLDLDTNSNGTVTFVGAFNQLYITGNSIDNLGFTGVTSINNLKVFNSTYEDLSFIPLVLFSTMSTIEIDSLDPSNIDTINTLLLDTNITLTSPITNQHVIDYNHDAELARLLAEEAISHVLHDTYFNLSLDDIVALFNANSYLDYLVEEDIRNDVTAGIVGIGLSQDVQFYFDKYMTEQTIYLDETEMRAALGDIEVDNMYTEITNTLSSPALVNIDSIVFASVNSSIEISATENALDLAQNKGWTVSE